MDTIVLTSWLTVSRARIIMMCRINSSCHQYCQAAEAYYKSRLSSSKHGGRWTARSQIYLNNDHNKSPVGHERLGRLLLIYLWSLRVITGQFLTGYRQITPDAEDRTTCLACR
jgi:hypothetical protein